MKSVFELRNAGLSGNSRRISPLEGRFDRIFKINTCSDCSTVMELRMIDYISHPIADRTYAVVKNGINFSRLEEFIRDDWDDDDD